MSDLHFKKIQLENFKTFSGAHGFNLDQTPGLYFVQGKNLLNPELGANGVGKSTLFDAILWVLFNKTGRDARPAAAISPWGKKGTTSVQLWFSRNGEDHFLYRTRSPNSLRYSAGASDDDREIAQEEVPGILGMSEEMLRRTLILGQFGTLFLDLRPEHQAQMFTEALSLDVWLKAVDEASADAKAIAGRLRDLESKEAANTALLQSTEGLIITAKEQADGFEAGRKRRLGAKDEQIEEQEILIEDVEKNKVEKPEMPGRKALDAINAEISPIREKRAVLKSEYNRLLTDIQKAEDALDSFKADQAKGNTTCSECGHAITKKAAPEHLAKLEKAVDDLDKLIDAKKKELDTCDAEGKAIKDRLDAAQADYDKAVRAHDRLSSDYDQWRRSLDRAKDRLDDLKRERVLIEGEANAHKQLHADAISRRAEQRTRKSDLIREREHEEKLEENAKLWVEAFREIRLAIIDETLIELEMAASRHMAMLGLEDWGIKFDTEREAKSGSVSYSFTILLYPPGRNDPVKWESYSGGESQRIQLAVAFGLSETLLSRAGLRPNIEVLDEPTRGLSPQGIEDLIEHLRDRALELGRAIFLVEHHSLDKGSFDGTLLITKDKKGSSIKWQ